MITEALTWAVHLEKEKVVPIFSIDISPRGNAFATGGEDGVVNVWNFAKALTPSNEASLLAEIKVHEETVNSVRFNHTGRLLASGGSDGVVSVAAWVPSSEPSWRPFRKWHQQKLDVSEVAWGTTTRRHMLASSSLDGTIVIWDVERGETCHVITGHKNMIKSVAWDPLGQFLASQADADGVFIWRTSDWKCIQQISEPFKDAVDRSDHLRLSWSPNGMYLTGVQAHVLPQPYVAVLSRDRWNVEFSVVGHHTGASISKWNPRFFHPRGRQSTDESDATKLVMCWCLGGLDGSFSLWLQTEKRPILHMDGAFEDRISDIAWSIDGYTCLIASRDGCVVLCNFTEEDLGVAASYQVSPMDVFPSSSKMPVAENIYLWMLEQNQSPAAAVLESQPQEKRGRLEASEEPCVAEMQSKRQKKVNSHEELLSRMTLDSVSTPQPPVPLAPKITSERQLPKESLRGKEKRSKTSFVHCCGKRQMSDGSYLEVQLAVENGISDRRCTIVCTEGPNERWRDEISDKAVAVTGNLHFSVIATDTSSLHVDISPQGLAPDVLLVALDGLDEVWGAQPLESPETTPHLSRLCLLALQRSTMCASLTCLTSNMFVCAVSTIQFSSNSLPIAILSDGHAYLYNTSLEAWTLISDPSQRQTGHQAMQIDTDEVRDDDLDALSLHASQTDVKHQVEQGITNAIELQSPSDYRKWLLAYVRFLICRVTRSGSATKDEETKLRKICTDLIQGHNAEMLDEAPVPFLRQQILPEMMRARDLQRLTEEIMDWIERL